MEVSVLLGVVAEISFKGECYKSKETALSGRARLSHPWTM